MQYSMKIHQKHSYAHVVAKGIACGEDFINITNDLTLHPDFDTGIQCYFDFTEMNAERISSYDLRTVSRFVSGIKNKFDNGKWALVFNDDLGFGLARMWQAFTENNVNFQIQIFKDKEDAFKWLHK